MKIVKRNGTEVKFDREKIANAIRKANRSVPPADQLPEFGIQKIAMAIEGKYSTSSTPPTVELVQDEVIDRLMEAGAHKLAHSYTIYRYEHELLRKANSTDARILSIVDGENAEAKVENANKNPTIISTQRDYIAGEVSKDISRRLLLPTEVTKAHDEGIIHFHDMDYFVCHSTNCNLVNLDDMLQNGTVISGTKIDKPHR